MKMHAYMITILKICHKTFIFLQTKKSAPIGSHFAINQSSTTAFRSSAAKAVPSNCSSYSNDHIINRSNNPASPEPDSPSQMTS